MVSMMVINQAESMANSIANSVKMEIGASAANTVKMSSPEKNQSINSMSTDVMAAITSKDYGIRG